MTVLYKIKDYFIGNLLRAEKDIIRRANIVAVFYVSVLALSLLCFLQFLYLFNNSATQQVIGIVSILVFATVLLLMKLSKKIEYIFHGALTFSVCILGLNLFIFPKLGIINGLLLASNIIITFNFLPRRQAFIYAFVQFSFVLIYLCNPQPLIPIMDKSFEQPLSEQISSFSILFFILLIIIIFYHSTHQNAVSQYKDTILDLKISEDRRIKTQALAKIGNWEFNYKTQELFWDQTTYKIFDIDIPITREAYIQKVVEEDRSKVIENIKKALEGNTYNLYYRILVNGEVKTIHSIGDIQLDDSGKPHKFYGVSQDITEIRNNEIALKNLIDEVSYQNSQLKNFTYIVSHNLRSHASNIKSLLNFLDQGKDDYFKILKMLKASAEKLDETLLNLNEIITISENSQKPKQEMNVKEEVLKTLDILNGFIHNYSISVELNIPDSITVKVIPSYFESILLNMLSNSIKYKAETRIPQIDINAYQDQDYIIIEVIDNGLGINLQKYGNKIFGMYKTFHDNEDARGLGLFITKNQIESMKGKIEVESEENVGTKFKLFFSEKN